MCFGSRNWQKVSSRPSERDKMADEVAQATGLSREIIASFERGDRIVPIDELKTLPIAFQRITDDCSDLLRRQVIMLSYQFGVSNEFCVQRLEQLNIVSKGTWELLESKGGINKNHENEGFGKDYMTEDPVKEGSKRQISDRLGIMGKLAWGERFAFGRTTFRTVGYRQGSIKRNFQRVSVRGGNFGIRRLEDYVFSPRSY